MELLDALGSTFNHAGDVIGGVRPDQLNDPTPCTKWDVRTLIGHSLGVVMNMGRGARGEELLANLDASILVDDIGAQFQAEAAATLAAWRARGFDGEVNVGAGPMPVQAAISINLLDTATHSWDIARATGQREDLPDDVAAMVLGVCQSFVTDEIRGFAGFDPAVAMDDNATPTQKMVAFLGRMP
jgi:uncharacterized protein (TIGR03086 family)